MPLPPGINPGAIEDVITASLKARNAGKAHLPHPQAGRRADASDADLDALKNGVGPDDLEREIASRAPAAANEASHVSTTDKAMEVASTVTEAPNKVVMYGVLPLMLAGGAVKTTGRVAEWWKGNKDAAKPGRISEFGHTMTAPIRAVNASFEDIGKKTGLGVPVGGAAKWTISTAGRPLDWVSNATGFNQWRAKRNNMHAGEHFSAVEGLFRDHSVDKITQSVKGIEELKEFEGLVGKLKNTAHAKDLVKHAADIEKAKKALYRLHPRKRPDAFSSLIESANSAKHYHEVGAQHAAGKGFQQAHKQIAKSSFGHGVWNASFVGMDAIGMFGTAKTFMGNVDSLKQMMADMTGKDVNSISTMKVLLGSGAGKTGSGSAFAVTEKGRVSKVACRR